MTYHQAVEQIIDLINKIEISWYKYSTRQAAEDIYASIAEAVRVEERERVHSLRYAGFLDTSEKVKLCNLYNQNLIDSKQKPLTEEGKYDFYRGVEYACDFILQELRTKLTALRGKK